MSISSISSTSGKSSHLLVFKYSWKTETFLRLDPWKSLKVENAKSSSLYIAYNLRFTSFVISLRKDFSVVFQRIFCIHSGFFVTLHWAKRVWCHSREEKCRISPRKVPHIATKGAASRGSKTVIFLGSQPKVYLDEF